MSLTFQPLARKRYRVHGTGLDKPPLIKEAAIQGYIRQHEGRNRQKARQTERAKRFAEPLRRARMFFGEADCPHCDETQLVNAGTNTCAFCKKDFFAYRPW